jgi:hypothetical protein
LFAAFNYTRSGFNTCIFQNLSTDKSVLVKFFNQMCSLAPDTRSAGHEELAAVKQKYLLERMYLMN